MRTTTVANTFIETRPEFQPVHDGFRRAFEEAIDPALYEHDMYGMPYGITGRVDSRVIEAGHEDFVIVHIKASYFASNASHDIGSIRVYGYKAAGQ